MAIEKVTREEREEELLQKSKLVFFIGEETLVRDIAYLLERRFFSAGILTKVIDSEILVTGICKDCIDNKISILERTLEIAKLFLDAGIISISFSSNHSIVGYNNIIESTDLILLNVNEKSIKFDDSNEEVELGQHSLEDAVHTLYKKLATSISQ